MSYPSVVIGYPSISSGMTRVMGFPLTTTEEGIASFLAMTAIYSFTLCFYSFESVMHYLIH